MPEAEAEQMSEPEEERLPDTSAEIAALRARLDGMLSAEKLSADDPLVLGYMQTQSAFSPTGQPLTPEQQMAEVIRKTKEYNTALLARTRQSARQPMGRSGAGKPETERKAEQGNRPLGSVYWQRR